MRLAPAVLSLVLSLSWLPGSAGAQGAAGQGASAPPAIGCPSLANLRILLHQAGDDPAAAAAILSDPKADHLSCVVLGRDKVTALVEQVGLNGRAYDCVSVQGTTVCHWTVSGTVVPVDPARAAARKRPPEKPPAEKPRR